MKKEHLVDLTAQGKQRFLLVGIEGRGEEDHPDVAFFVLDEEMVNHFRQTRAAALSTYNQATLDGRPVPTTMTYAGRFIPAFGTDLRVFVTDDEEAGYAFSVDDAEELDDYAYQKRLWVYADSLESFYTLETKSLWLEFDSEGNTQFIARVDGEPIEGSLKWGDFPAKVCPTCGSGEGLTYDSGHTIDCPTCYYRGNYPAMFVQSWPLEVESD